MRNWIIRKLRTVLGIENDKNFLLMYGDAISLRIDRME
jgi:hypothetical protein